MSSLDFTLISGLRENSRTVDTSSTVSTSSNEHKHHSQRQSDQNANKVFQTDILITWKTRVVKSVAGSLEKHVPSCKILCREPEDFIDTFPSRVKQMLKRYMLEQNLKEDNYVSSAKRKLEEFFK